MAHIFKVGIPPVPVDLEIARGIQQEVYYDGKGDDIVETAYYLINAEGVETCHDVGEPRPE